MQDDTKYIYTLGTSTRSIEEFIRLLKSHGIETVVNIRRFPTSRFEHFHSDNLSRFLEEADIRYIHMGEELGGHRRGGYEAFMETDTFVSGLDRLEEIATESRTAIVCAERFPWRCHRRFIGAGLEGRGWTVCHIIDEGRDWIPGKKQSGRSGQQ